MHLTCDRVRMSATVVIMQNHGRGQVPHVQRACMREKHRQRASTKRPLDRGSLIISQVSNPRMARLCFRVLRPDTQSSHHNRYLRYRVGGLNSPVLLNSKSSLSQDHGQRRDFSNFCSSLIHQTSAGLCKGTIHAPSPIGLGTIAQ